MAEQRRLNVEPPKQAGSSGLPLGLSVIPSDAIAATTAKRILLVEDYEAALSMLAHIVRSFGYETIEATTGADAIEKALIEIPDLIVMDIGLPDMTGVDAAKAIKQNPSTSRLPMIAYSAWYTRSWMEEAKNVGIATCLVKPVPMALMKDRKVHSAVHVTFSE